MSHEKELLNKGKEEFTKLFEQLEGHVGMLVSCNKS